MEPFPVTENIGMREYLVGANDEYGCRHVEFKGELDIDAYCTMGWRWEFGRH